jgi:hypothetical protein
LSRGISGPLASKPNPDQLLHPEIKAATSSAAVHNEATDIRGSSLLG